jgi:hypothetical protein
MVWNGWKVIVELGDSWRMVMVREGWDGWI